MPTADREGLREALASAILEEMARGKDTSVHWIADELIAGPLSATLAQADTAAQAVAERDEARDSDAESLSLYRNARDRADRLIVQRDDALAEVARLSAEVEARDKALKRIAGMKAMGLVADGRPDGTATYEWRQKPSKAALLARTALAAGQDKEGGKPTDPTPQKERADG